MSICFFFQLFPTHLYLCFTKYCAITTLTTGKYINILYRINRNNNLDRGLRGNVKKKQYIYRHYPNWGWPPSLLPYFWQIYFWHSVDHVDLPPSPRIFDKNHEILGFETYILYYPYYFLRVRGTDRKTQSPFKWIFFIEGILQIPLYGFPYYNGTI